LLHDHDREYGGDPGDSDQRGWMNAGSCAERYRCTRRARGDSGDSGDIRLLEDIEGVGLREAFGLEHVEWFPGALTGGALWLAAMFGRERIDRIGFRQVNRLGFIHQYS
jgi:hypothetical protein